MLLTLGLFIAVASVIALRSGLGEWRLDRVGRIEQLPVEALPGRKEGFWAVAGCVRHDLAVGVGSSGRVYRLGAGDAEPADEDRVFTPLSGRDECDDRPPRRIYALVEDDDALSNTIGHVYRAKVAPPPVLAVVEGVAGFSVGHAALAEQASRRLTAEGLGVKDLPLILKGRRPGVFWVAVVTTLAGVHGLVLVLLGLVFVVRRLRPAPEREPDVETEFFGRETIE
jgi:hypothetical protein